MNGLNNHNKSRDGNSLRNSHGILINNKYDINSTQFDNMLDRLFDLYLNSLNRNPPICTKKQGKRISINKRKDVFRTVISCLFYEWSHSTYGHHCCVRYYRTKSHYTHLPFSFSLLREVVDWLDSNNYIESYIGGYDRETSNGKTSRMRPRTKLALKFRAINHIGNIEDKAYDSIIIRDHGKNNHEFDKAISELFESLLSDTYKISYLDMQRKINETRMNSRVRITNKPFVITPLKRIYNNSHFGSGGRFYGSPEQLLPKSVREKLTINDSDTIELDYGNLHIKMLYDISGHTLSGDAYLIYDLHQNQYDRTLMKQSVMIMINASSVNEARLAIQNKINQLGLDHSYKAKEIMDAINKQHNAISSYFNSGEGLSLQSIDSKIALDVMYHFSKNDIPCLCIHDSFIVESEYKYELETVMKEKYRKHLSYERFKTLERTTSKPLEHPIWTNYFKSLKTNDFFINIS